MRGSAPLLNAGLSPLIASAMDIGPQPRSPPNCMAYVLARPAYSCLLRCVADVAVQRGTPRAACADGGLKGELQICGRYMAVPICRCHQGGRDKLMLLRTSGLERLAAPRPGCGFNGSDVSKSRWSPHQTRTDTLNPPPSERFQRVNRIGRRGSVVVWAHSVGAFERAAQRERCAVTDLAGHRGDGRLA